MLIHMLLRASAEPESTQFGVTCARMQRLLRTFDAQASSHSTPKSRSVGFASLVALLQTWIQETLSKIVHRVRKFGSPQSMFFSHALEVELLMVLLTFSLLAVLLL